MRSLAALGLSLALATGCVQKQGPASHVEATSSYEYKYCLNTTFLEGIHTHLPAQDRDQVELEYLNLYAMRAAFEAKCGEATDDNLPIFPLSTSEPKEEGAQTCVNVYVQVEEIVCPDGTRRR